QRTCRIDAIAIVRSGLICVGTTFAPGVAAASTPCDSAFDSRGHDALSAVPCPAPDITQKERRMVHRSLCAVSAYLTLVSIVVPASGFAQQPGAPAPVGIPAKPPVLNRANELLPQWFRLRGEFRERMEGFDGLGFNATREDLYWLSRFRLSATATASKGLSFQA